MCLTEREKKKNNETKKLTCGCHKRGINGFSGENTFLTYIYMPQAELWLRSHF